MSMPKTYIFEEYYLTLSLDFLCPRFLFTLYHVQLDLGVLEQRTLVMYQISSLIFVLM